MVDIAGVVKAFPGVRPVAGLDGCWTWSAGRFYFVLALTAEGGHAMQPNCRDVLDLDLVVTVLAFARARSEAVLAAAPFAVLEGFTSPSATPFDSVAAVIPAVHRYQEFDRPDLNEVTYAVFPAYRCEFSGLETQEEATYRFDYMLDAANLQRPPSPWSGCGLTTREPTRAVSVRTWASPQRTSSCRSCGIRIRRQRIHRVRELPE